MASSTERCLDCGASLPVDRDSCPQCGGLILRSVASSPPPGPPSSTATAQASTGGVRVDYRLGFGIVCIGALLLLSLVLYKAMSVVSLIVFLVAMAMVVLRRFHTRVLALFGRTYSRKDLVRVIAIAAVSGACAFLAVSTWFAKAEKAAQAQRREDAEIARNRELLSEMNSIMQGDIDQAAIDRAKQLARGVTDHRKTQKQALVMVDTINEAQHAVYLGEGKSLLAAKQWENGLEELRLIPEGSLHWAEATALIPDAERELKRANYQRAVNLFEEGRHGQSLAYFKMVGDYEDSLSYVAKLKEIERRTDYKAAVALYKDGKIDEAGRLFAKVGDWKRAREYLAKIERAQQRQRREREAEARRGERRRQEQEHKYQKCEARCEKEFARCVSRCERKYGEFDPRGGDCVTERCVLDFDCDCEHLK